MDVNSYKKKVHKCLRNKIDSYFLNLFSFKFIDFFQ